MPGTGGDPISQLMQMIGAQPLLIVCGRLGLEPLTDDQRHGLLANVNIFDALETVARLQGRWDDQLSAGAPPVMRPCEIPCTTAASPGSNHAAASGESVSAVTQGSPFLDRIGKRAAHSRNRRVDGGPLFGVQRVGFEGITAVTAVSDGVDQSDPRIAPHLKPCGRR
jgi:hypothetical protein